MSELSDKAVRVINTLTHKTCDIDFCEKIATSPHTCPYAEDIHGNHDKCCCCNDCTNQCAMDV